MDAEHKGFDAWQESVRDSATTKRFLFSRLAWPARVNVVKRELIVMAVSVNGVLIAEAKIQEEMTRLRPEYTSYVRSNDGEPSEKQLREWAVEDLIEATLFRQAAVATQPVPSDERVQQYIKENAELYGTLPPEECFKLARETLQQRRMIKEIRKGVPQPGDEAVRAYYDANPGMFMMPEILRLSHICHFVNSGNKADAFLDLLRIKTDLADGRIDWLQAVENFSDSFQRDRGLFDPVSRDDVPAEIEAKLFALKEDEISDVIELDGRSLHLFRLLVREAPRVIEFKEAKEHLVGVLFEQSCQEALHAKFDALKEAAVIQREG